MRDKTLLIEDGAGITRFLSLPLDKNGYKVTEARDSIEGISLFTSDSPDLILLDLGLPDTDGSEALRQIRSQSEMPTPIVSVRGQEREKVEALDFGADNYVTKSLRINGLLAGVWVALCKKTLRTVKEKMFALDSLRVDFEKYKVYVEGREVHLMPIGFKLLVLLIEYVDKVLTHSFTIRNIWGYSSCEDPQSLRVFMVNICRKIEKDSSHPCYILTEVDVGYRSIGE